MKKYKLLKYPKTENIQEGGKRHKKHKKQKRYNNPFAYKKYNNITIDGLDKVTDKNKFYNIEYGISCPGYMYTPTIMPAVKRMVVLGDIHGDLELFITLLRKAQVIEGGSVTDLENIRWVGGKTHIVQVGDQVDRCRPLGALTCNNPMTTYADEASDIKIMELANKLKSMAKQVGGDVISLLGNHELMNVMGNMSYVSHANIKEFEHYRDKNNPGLVFRNALEARKYAFLPGNEYGKMLGCTRLTSVVVGSHIFVHAGFVDGLIHELQMNKNSDLETINIAVSKWLLGLLSKDYIDHIVNGSRYSPFWTRILGMIPPNVNLKNPVCEENISKVLQLFNVNGIIIGHTPTVFTFADKINATCSNKVWRVDTGQSKAFHKFDEVFMETGEVKEARKPMALEILNDNEYRIIK
jgi:hypothetical protein